ncbi:MAG: TRAP transporter permease [Eubacteriales bacterium]|nr:TRAP transporter permease [Eubacteriales bacterium]MDD4134296.1 TRAP transporter permease [Eubacteriales bacterium]
MTKENPPPAGEEQVEHINQEEIRDIMSKYDRESAFRVLSGYRGLIISALCVIFSLLQLYSTWFIIPSTHMRPLHLGIVTMLSYFLYPLKRGGRKDTLPWHDLALGLVSLALFLYPVVFFNQIVRQNSLLPYQYLIGGAAVLLLMEACRRVVGIPIVIIATFFMLIAFFGRQMPGFLSNRGFSVLQIIKHLFFTQEGVFGTPVGASSTFIFLFILFGAFLEKTGVGEFFIDLSNAIAGNKRGGPAKVAVITSAFEGTVSGSSVANTVGSGSFTIPMMKRLGYRPEFAAAVEAAASTGGQIMPPVMGAAAFLMAESVGVPYSVVVKAAIIPALLYFAGIYIVTDLEAKKQGLRGMDKDKMPRLLLVLKERGHLILPLVAIIYVLGAGFTPSVAALVGIGIALFGGYMKTFVQLIAARAKGRPAAPVIRESKGLRPRDYLQALEAGARSILGVALACGVAGIIAGMITLTGIGLKMGSGLTALAGGSLILLLIFTMFSSILLGMGVPTTANYLITSTIMAPVVARALAIFLPDVYGALQAISPQLAILPAHLFTFYFGIIADITPPVALAAMAGAAIAKSNPLRTGVEASRLAIAAFLVPYIFVYSPQMLMLNAQWHEILLITVTALIGMFGIGMAVEKFWERKLNIVQQLMALGGGLLLIIPGLVTDAAGFALIAGVIIWQKIQIKRAPSEGSRLPANQ